MTRVAARGAGAGAAQQLDPLRASVQAAADASAEHASAIVERAGMSVKRPGLHTKPLLEARPGVVLGSARLIAKSAGDRASYAWQCSLDGASWLDLPPTRKAKADVHGFTQATRVFFRCRSFTSAGLGDWSQPVSLLVE